MGRGHGLGGRPLMSKWQLGYYLKFSSWRRRAARGHERAAQRRAWRKEADRG